MKRSFLVTLGLAGIVVMSLAFTNDEPRFQTNDDPGFKNLKILPRKITEKQLDSVMHHFNSSLGVKCSFCHVRNAETDKTDFASDDNKHKLVARQMMKMTKNINDKYFDVVGNKKDPLNIKLMVTCFTCHNGKTEPSVTPPPRERNNQQRTASPDSTKRK